MALMYKIAAKSKHAALGVRCALTLDLPQMMRYKTKTVENMVQHATQLLGRYGVKMASMICEDFARICHPYPSWSETVRQAATVAGGWMMRA
ncbi:hypothetical protein [Paraburkholderia bannensis]|uniref:hypothetical protein n=1 Tax=Paraburkholderia bannensis TaxID=765414 RepID=UPI00157B78DA|nr:hypothetical protein [Paraburkholderia bannensis]